MEMEEGLSEKGDSEIQDTSCLALVPYEGSVGGVWGPEKHAEHTQVDKSFTGGTDVVPYVEASSFEPVRSPYPSEMPALTFGEFPGGKVKGVKPAALKAAAKRSMKPKSQSPKTTPPRTGRKSPGSAKTQDKPSKPKKAEKSPSPQGQGNGIKTGKRVKDEIEKKLHSVIWLFVFAVLLAEVYSAAHHAARLRKKDADTCRALATQARYQSPGNLIESKIPILRWAKDHGPQDHEAIRKILF